MTWAERLKSLLRAEIPLTHRGLRPPGDGNDVLLEKRDYQWDVFLSHAAEDKPLVEPIAIRMRDAGLRVWFDKWEIGVDRIPKKIDEGLGGSKRFVLFASPNSMKSEWVSKELDATQFQNHEDVKCPLIVVLLAQCTLKPLLRSYGHLDFRTPGSEPWQALLEACEAPGDRTPVDQPADSPTKGKIKPFSRDGEKLFKKLRERIVDTVAGSAKVMDLLSRQLFPAPSLDRPASFAQHDAEQITKALLGKTFEEVKEILLNSHKQLNKTNPRDADLTHRVARLTLPWLYVCSGVNSEQLLARGGQEILLEVLRIPAGIESMAALIMAGINRNEVEWGGDQKSFPRGKNQLSSVRPEGGMQAAEIDEIRQDLHKRIEIPAQAQTPEQQRAAINRQMKHMFVKDGERYYLLCDPAPTKPDALLLYKDRLQTIQNHFPILAIVELDGNMLDGDQDLFNEIRDLLC